VVQPVPGLRDPAWGLKETLGGLWAVHSAGMAYGMGGYLDQVKDLYHEGGAVPEPRIHIEIRGLEPD